MVKRLSIVALFVAIFVMLSACQLTTIKSTANSSTSISEIPESPIPEGAESIFPKELVYEEPTLDASELLGMSINALFEKFGSLATVPGDYYDGAPYMLIQDPYNLLCYFEPTGDGESTPLYSGSETITVIDTFAVVDESTQPIHISVGGFPRDTSFNEYKEIYAKYPELLEFVEIKEDFYSEMNGTNNHISATFSLAELSMTWWDGTSKDAPPDEIRLWYTIPVTEVEKSMKKMLAMVGADMANLYALDRNSAIYEFYKGTEYLGTYTYYRTSGTDSYSTPATEAAFLAREAERMEQVRIEQEVAEAERQRIAEENAKNVVSISGDGVELCVGDTVYQKSNLFTAQGNIVSCGNGLIEVKWTGDVYTPEGWKHQNENFWILTGTNPNSTVTMRPENVVRSLDSLHLGFGF